VADEDGIEVVAEPTLRRQAEQRVGKFAAQLLVEALEIGETAVQKPAESL